MQPKLELLKDIGVSLSTLDRSQAQTIEPALDPEYPLHAAVYFPQDEITNGRQFAHLLKDRAMELGVQFQFGAKLVALHPGPPVQLEFSQSPPTQTFEHVVLCTGTGSGAISGFGKLPLTELHSYSISAPIRDTLNAPRSAIFDCSQATSIGRLGARVRVSGGAELGGTTEKIRTQTTRQLFNTLQNSFPGAASYQNGTQIWKGKSFYTPDALPLVGPSTTPGVWLNLGHGNNGWSMCCGTAQVIADMLGARAATVDLACLQPSRFPI